MTNDWYFWYRSILQELQINNEFNQQLSLDESILIKGFETEKKKKKCIHQFLEMYYENV